MRAAFWALVAVVGYAYVGYGLCAWIIARLRPRPAAPGSATPSVTLIIPCYLEERFIAAKIENSLQLEYPSDKLEIIVIVGGAEDATARIAQSYASRGITCIEEPVRSGKEAAMQVAARQAHGEILVFTDANAMLNPCALRQMMRWFSDPEVGCVSGEKRVVGGEEGEGIYWKYESALKRWDSRIGSTMGAAGELIAIRASLMTFGQTDNIIEDFALSMRVVEAGYRVIYEPGAIASEEGLRHTEEVFERRARIAAGGFQAIWRLRRLLDPRFGLVHWQYVSHRVLRWAVVPIILPILPVINFTLARDSRWYRLVLVGQLGLYGAAGLGWSLQRSRVGRLPFLAIPCFFCSANIAALAGLWRILSGRQTVLWRRVRA
jgi:poly-beta-1,6-N-acetyl-D-glucosamine synthase